MVGGGGGRWGSGWGGQGGCVWRSEGLLHEQNIDILCLSETFLNQEFCDDELKINGYDFIRKDRQTHGGGLII